MNVWWKIAGLALVAGVIIWFLVLLARMNRRTRRAWVGDGVIAVGVIAVGAEMEEGPRAAVEDISPRVVRTLPAIRQRW